jgi:hypothetical protein
MILASSVQIPQGGEGGGGEAGGVRGKRAWTNTRTNAVNNVENVESMDQYGSIWITELRMKMLRCHLGCPSASDRVIE